MAGPWSVFECLVFTFFKGLRGEEKEKEKEYAAVTIYDPESLKYLLSVPLSFSFTIKREEEHPVFSIT